MEHPVWRQLFGFEIDQGKAFWRARKEQLAKELAILRTSDCRERVADNRKKSYGNSDDRAPVPSQKPPERRIEPLSDEWFDDLDKSIDEISRLFEEMRVAPPEAEDVDYIQEAEDGLAAMEQDLTKCFTDLETLKRRLGDSGPRDSSKSTGSADDDVFKLFRPRSVSVDEGGLKRISKTKRRVGHRKSMPSISSSLGDAVMTHLFGCWQPCERGCVPDIHHSHDDLTLVKMAEANRWLIH